MPFTVFGIGQEALAADVNNYLMEQTVARFTNATQRTTQLVAPELNQLSMLDNRPGTVQYWTGSAWADLFPLIQFATGALTFDGNGMGTFAFPIAFGGTPTVQACAVIGSGTLAWTCQMGTGTTASTCQLYMVNSNSTPVTGNLTISWLAIGPRP